MHIEGLREYCLRKKGAEETLPFGPDTLVFKVGGKMFALIGLDDPRSTNLKCDPDRALELREQHPEDIRPGWHMNKKHWNTVELQGGLSDNLIKELIDHSYDLVVAGLPKKIRENL